jgi:hypothetical protein
MDIGMKSGAAKLAAENRVPGQWLGTSSAGADFICAGQCRLANAVWLRVLTDLLFSAVTKINTPLNISSKMALKTVMKMALDAALKTKVN